ncbi:hypothetical protein GIS00_00065 [Nakamurella sp. YIM 132087]|uniref:IclR-ED domain-containing protein n=2 Tax=Nakamurella alba TaxID=2665158 RepID=A0A7K1FE07_9ACTN|nr:hypothetical protein [Nakamurella alba]
MAELRDAVGETIHLSVAEGPWVVLVEKVESGNPVRTYSAVGTRYPIHATSAGLAILSATPPEAVRSILGDGPFVGVTPETPTELAAVLESARQAEQLGYAVGAGTRHAEVTAIGAAIRNAAGQPIAALSISAPSSRMPQEVWAAYGARVRAAADRVTARLGGVIADGDA